MINWNPTFFTKSALFKPLLIAEQFSSFQHWPNLNDLNKLLNDKQITSQSGEPIRFIEHQLKQEQFADHYEPRIYLKGEIQTRTNNWHDFFNAMVWLTFSKTKAVLNEYQYLSLKNRTHSADPRTPLENALTLFDENGAVILSTNSELTHLFRTMQWKELFWHRRKEVLNQMQFLIFGHSLYEKALQPYIGMTANSIVIDISESFFKLDMAQQIKDLDKLLCQFLVDRNIQSPKQLSPLPVLGVPGWCLDNENPEYYDNTNYFRTCRGELVVRPISI